MNDLVNEIDSAFECHNDKYILKDNKELIDVEDRFRLVTYEERTYVAKKSSLSKAISERNNAEMAYERLCPQGEKRIAGINISVVVPQIVIGNEHTYLISRYLGKSMQSNLYDGKKRVISIKQLFLIQQYFLESGIIYRGFLPRNTIFNKESMYLIDWEDAIFSLDSALQLNRLCETNFVLNWMYFFNRNSLVSNFRNLQTETEWKEPKLLPYEILLISFLGWNDININESRRKIEQFVFEAEYPCADGSFVFPNDFAHLISDLFSTEIDVLFDSISFLFRKADDEEYTFLLKILEQYIRKNVNKLAYLRPNILFVLLLMININVSKYSYSRSQNLDVEQLIEAVKSDEAAPIWVKFLHSMQIEEFHYSIKALIKELRYKINNVEFGQQSNQAVCSIVNYICNVMFVNNE